MRKFSLAAILSIALLGGCSSHSPSSLSPTGAIQSPYKRSVEFTGENHLLQNSLIQQAKKSGIIADSSEGFSEFRITYNVLAETPSTLREMPRFNSKLTRSTEPVSLNVKYTVYSGNVSLIDGEVSRLIDVKNSVYPRIQEHINIPENVLSGISQEIIREAQAFIRTTPWSSPVIGMSAHNHVVIGAGRESGLNIRDLFVTQTHPVAQMEVVSFEDHMNGNSRAILRLVSGTLPTIGKRVIPVSLAHKK